MTAATPWPASPAVCLPVHGSDQQFPVHRVYCVGRNYAAHAQEMGYTGREPPFFFLKPNDALVPIAAQGGSIPYPSLTQDLHHEVELVVAIGTGGHDIDPKDAMAHVYGYAVGLDMTRRDLQMAMREQGRPWDIGKAFDASAPIGPITPAAHVANIEQAAISLHVNDAPRQASTVAHLIWNVAETIAHLSNAWALQPGDLIFTGTPEGVGAVQRGDRMHAHVQGLQPITVSVR